MWTRRVVRKLAYLVVNFLGGVLQVDCLLEDIALLFKLDALGPVVEGSCDVDFFGRVLPTKAIESAHWVA